VSAASPPPHESLLVFSDVHLGSDIQEGVENQCRRSPEVDRDLVLLLAHYRARPGRWRIVIAGDFIDFIGITLAAPPGESLETPPTEEERSHGVGGASDHARLKLRRVAERHADVFAALAAFVSDGHALSIVHGNHDIELHWDGVKDDFREILVSHAGVAVAVEADRAAFVARIEFNPWFFYRDGLAYIEHGHQYDPFCATAHVMSPLDPADRRRVARGFSDTLIRFVVRPTRGMKEHGHETAGLGHYVAFGVDLGLRGMTQLVVRFARAVYELFRLRRQHLSLAAAALRAEHDQRVAKLAEATHIGLERLRALLSLQTPPITASIRGILASVLLDRLALGFMTAGALSLLSLASLLHQREWLFGIPLVVLAWWLGNRRLSQARTVDPAEVMRERAAHLARLFPAAFVVMGHTHVPTSAPAGEATYVNLGSWVEEDGHAYRAARTHLVIEMGEGGPEARFCSWGPDGPRRRPLGS
jgi:UDP-2,3-diacylglucosamine pyrophosphatase LpxH